MKQKVWYARHASPEGPAGLALRVLDPLPPAFKRFDDINGTVHYAVFENADGSDEEVRAGLLYVIPPDDDFWIDADYLPAISNRAIDERTFFGGCYDYADGLLLAPGRYRTEDGSIEDNPPITRARWDDFAGIVGDGRFARGYAPAFSCTHYPLQAPRREVQQLFEDIRDFILPPYQRAEIFDWSCPELKDVSDFFRIGIDWDGSCYLYSIYIPAVRRLTLVASSTSP